MVFKLHGTDENAINKSQDIRYEAQISIFFTNFILICNCVYVYAPMHELRCECLRVCAHSQARK